jgi:hypothetical protein
MFSLGNFDWKNALNGGSFLRDLGRAQGGMLRSLISGRDGNAISTGERSSDLLSLSKPFQLLQQSGLDLERSYIREESQQLNFSFSFQDEHVRNLTTDGFLDARSQVLKMDFSFQSSLKMVDPVTGVEREEMFQFEFHLEARSFQMQEGQGEVRKEDILDFANKILKKISKLRTEGKEIDGLVLDKEDLRDFGAVEGGKLLRQIGHLIDLMKSVDRLNNRKGEHELLAPKREKSWVFGEKSYEESSLNFSLSVTRVESTVSSMEDLLLEAASSEVGGDATPETTGASEV